MGDIGNTAVTVDFPVNLAVILRGSSILLRGYRSTVVELVVCGKPAVVDAIEDKTNMKLLRLIADIKESLLLEVNAILKPFDIATKCFSYYINRHCTIR